MVLLSAVQLHEIHQTRRPTKRTLSACNNNNNAFVFGRSYIYALVCQDNKKRNKCKLELQVWSRMKKCPYMLFWTAWGMELLQNQTNVAFSSGSGVTCTKSIHISIPRWCSRCHRCKAERCLQTGGVGIDNIMGYLQGMGNWALRKMEEELKCSASKPIFL